MTVALLLFVNLAWAGGAEQRLDSAVQARRLTESRAVEDPLRAELNSLRPRIEVARGGVPAASSVPVPTEDSLRQLLNLPLPELYSDKSWDFQTRGRLKRFCCRLQNDKRSAQRVRENVEGGRPAALDIKEPQE